MNNDPSYAEIQEPPTNRPTIFHTHVAVEASTALYILLDLPILRSTKGKLVAEYAAQVQTPCKLCLSMS